MRTEQQPQASLARVVLVTGRVDGSTVAGLRETLHAAVDSSDGPIVVDVAGVDTIDVTGLAMLIGTRRRASALGHELLLRDVPVRMARLLRVTRLDRVLQAETDLPVGAS